MVSVRQDHPAAKNGNDAYNAGADATCKQHASSVQSTQSAPDRISVRTQFMKQRVAGMETVAPAMKQLYAVLTPQQKEILDARFGQNMPM